MSDLNERQWVVKYGMLGSVVPITEVVKAYRFEIEDGSIVFKKMLAANMFTNVACFPSEGTIVREYVDNPK